MEASLKSRIIRRTVIAVSAWSLLMVGAFGLMAYSTSATGADTDTKSDSKSSGAPSARSTKRNQSTP